MNESENAVIARRYLEALERGPSPEELAAFFAPEVIQEEFPNRLMTHGARRDLQGLLDASERGKQVISGQRFDIRHVIAQVDQVAVELLWTGKLLVSLGTLAAGSEMRAHFATFLDFRDGKIVGQRNYDCFEPW